MKNNNELQTVIKVNKGLAEKIKKDFRFIESGTENIINSFYILQTMSLYEIRGKFSKEELKTFSIILRRRKIEPSMVGPNFLQLLIENNVKYKTDKIPDIDIDFFLKKISQLTFAQCFAISNIFSSNQADDENYITKYLEILL